MSNVHEAVDQFMAAMREAGLMPPDTVEADGRLHRFSTNGKHGDDAGWYVLHPDGIPAGAFGCWRGGVHKQWRANMGRTLTPAEEELLQERLETIAREREAEQARRHAAARERAARIWSASEPATLDHPYLAKKGIKAHGVRIYRGDLIIGGTQCDGGLVVPLRNAAGEIQTLELIDREGNKRFLPGGAKAGGYYIIGTPSDIIAITEGFATGASIYEATGYAAMVAFDAGNLKRVALVVREKFPSARIVICGDNDETGRGQGEAELGKV